MWRMVLLGWFAITSVLAAQLLASHLLPVPNPSSQDPIAQAGYQEIVHLYQAAQNHDDKPNTKLLMIHTLYADCLCSKRLVEYLQKREQPWPAAVDEMVILVENKREDGGGDGEKEAEALEQRGFQVVRVDPETLATRFGMTAAPLLTILSTKGAALYSGGYSEQKQGPAVRDLEIVEALIDKRAVDSLPLFGCAVAKNLQKMLDPLRIKYARE